MDIKQNIVDALKKKVKQGIVLEIPPDSSLGDYAFPCFSLAKEMRKAPPIIAKEISESIGKISGVSQIKAAGPYVNFFVDKKSLIKTSLSEVFTKKEKYGYSSEGKGKTIVIDFSSPNIAKPFGIAHIRSTVIGNSLSKVLKSRGFKIVKVNHLGDWGTQFGKLIVAYKKWGDKKKLLKEGIGHLVNIYVKFGEEAEKNEELNDEARAWFKKLEDGNKEALELWEFFKKMSIQEFKKYYAKLNIEFDSWNGEAFYNDKIDAAIKAVEKKVATEIDEGALIVRLKEDVPPVLLRKSDEASTYHARDIAAALYRLEEYKADKLVYVVGSPQILHFKQLFEVLSMMGIKKELLHVPFGNMTYEGSMMSTRAGNFVLLEEVLDKAVELALKTINSKNPKLKNKIETAEKVGIGAIIFADLVNDRVRDVDFSWDRALDFEGETGPYLQYTHARICSLLEKSKCKLTKDVEVDNLDAEFEIVKKLEKFDEAISQAAQNYKPHIIARYLLDLAQLFNSYYQNNPILNQEPKLKHARLLVCDCVRQVLANGLDLLGLKSVEEM